MLVEDAGHMNACSAHVDFQTKQQLLCYIGIDTPLSATFSLPQTSHFEVQS